MTSAKSGVDSKLIITRIFDAPRERLWDAWTKPEQYARWSGPKGCKTELKSADIRPGGLLHSKIETPDGHVMWARCIYREVARPSRLTWVQSFSDSGAKIVGAPFFGGIWPREMLTEVSFEEEGAQTRLTLTWTPINASAEEQAMFQSQFPSMRGGWSSSLEELEEHLATVASPGEHSS